MGHDEVTENELDKVLLLSLWKHQQQLVVQQTARVKQADVHC